MSEIKDLEKKESLETSISKEIISPSSDVFASISEVGLDTFLESGVWKIFQFYLH